MVSFACQVLFSFAVIFFSGTAKFDKWLFMFYNLCHAIDDADQFGGNSLRRLGCTDGKKKMITPEQKQFFLEQGYLHLPAVLAGSDLTQMQAEFDRVWESEQPPVGTCKLLKHPAFLKLVENPKILEVHRTFFGRGTQLLQYDLLRQGPRSEAAARAWHRDFTHPGDYPLAINTIVYFDDMTEEVGPTRVVPGTHRGTALPPPEMHHDPLPGEVAAYAKAGDVVFINAAIWHTGGRNTGDGLRRGAYLYYGYWWLRPYSDIGPGKYELPWQALEGATQERLELLGLKLPLSDIHMYRPEEVAG